MSLNPSMEAALKGAAPLVCLLLKLELPAHTIRICDGAAQIAFDGELYSGEDSIYGVLDQVEEVREQTGTEAPRFRFSFLPKNLISLAEITQPEYQGSPLKVWFAVVNPATGTIVGTPEPIFVGELDSADVDANETVTVIHFDAASGWERFFEDGEGYRLNHSFMSTYWPDAQGLQFVSMIQRQLPWNSDLPRPAVVADTIGGFTGGFGGSVGIGGGGGSYGGGDLYDWAQRL